MLTILCAMQPEADAIISALNLTPTQTPWAQSLPPKLWTGTISEHPITLVTNGFDARTSANLIGTTPATLATMLLIEHLAPSAILVAGAAGGCSKSTSIGEVFLIDRAFHHDRRIPLPEFADYAHGPEPLHCSELLARAFSVRIASISTGNALDTLDHELEFFDKHAVSVKDMETASIAWTAAQLNTRVIALRSITDFYDHPAPENQFLANFDLALSNLASTIKQALPKVIGEL
jgi:nucleoside phosphorylase